MSAREAIFAALGPAADPTTVARDAAALLDGIRHQPPLENLAEAFAAALAQPAIGATLAWIADAVDVPREVADYAARHGLPRTVTHSAPGLAGDWRDFMLAERPPVDGGLVVSRAVAAVAETGSVILESGPGRPMLADFLALHHVVLVEREDIVATLDDIPPPAAIPRARYWVTGVSGTTDIEGQYIRGAHGPRFLHIILVG